MTRMLRFLRNEVRSAAFPTFACLQANACHGMKCALDENSMMIDLGHGMGRPNLHAAVLVPPIKARYEQLCR